MEAENAMTAYKGRKCRPGEQCLASLDRLPKELLLIVAEFLNPEEVLALSSTCRYIAWVLAWLARPRVKLRYPRVLEMNFSQERRIVLAQLGLLSRVLKRFRRGRVVIDDDGYAVTSVTYAPGLLFLRDTIIMRLPHLFAPIAATLTADQIRSPMNGSTLEQIARHRGYLKVVKIIQALPRGALP